VKKTLFLVMACVMIFSSVALADYVPAFTPDNTPANGEIVFVGGAVVNDLAGYRDSAPRYLWPEDQRFGNQSAVVSVPLTALIPCHLEMTFTGNDMNGKLESWGADGAASWNGGGSWIGFYPSIGGYIDHEWNYIAGSTANKNQYEIEPSEVGETNVNKLVYIRACDTFKAEIWSNMKYKYTVGITNGGKLKLNGGDPILPIEMRSAVLDGKNKSMADLTGATWAVTSSFAAPVDLLETTAACEDHTIFHQFRVPFSKSFAAGEYGTEKSTIVSFTAATI
jgi:hypothetical protein